MAITTNDVAQGLVDGLDHGITGSIAGVPETVQYSFDDPDTKVAALGSQIMHDVANDELYMCETDGNTDWIHLGSIS